MKIQKTIVIGFLCILIAIPTWTILILIGHSSIYIGIGEVLVALCGTTAAIHYLLRPWKNAWAISAAAAGGLLLSFLYLLAWWTNR